MPLPVPQDRRIQAAIALATLAANASAWAHESHGMGGGHWHATDIWGVLAAAAFAALVFHRRR